MSCLSVHHHTPAAECHKKKKKTAEGQVNVYCVWEHMAAHILPFSSRVQQSSTARKTGPLRSSSTVPTAFMSAAISSGKSSNKSIKMFLLLLPLSHEKRSIAHTWTTTPIQVDNSNPLWHTQCKQSYEWDAASMAIVWQDEICNEKHTSTDAPQRSWHYELFPLKL